ncbi:energy transducer TonB [Alteriqipengyuania sp. 357]
MAYAYANQSQNRLPAIAAVAGIHAGIGALLIYGLATGEFAKSDPPPLVGGQIELPPAPPPPDPVETPRPDTPTSSREIMTPMPPVTLNNNPPQVDTTDIILPPAPPMPNVIPSVLPTLDPPPPPPSPTPSFDPVAARPSNSPGSWVTQSDYRSAWISRDYEGTVGFRLKVGASGKVENCAITRSNGISALDQATCQLVERRARFSPAQNADGRAVAGSYNGAVRWQLPD